MAPLTQEQEAQWEASQITRDYQETRTAKESPAGLEHPSEAWHKNYPN